MAMLALEAIRGKKLITQDAYLLGEVLDIRYEAQTWNVIGMKVKTGSSVSLLIGTGVSKSVILLEPGKYVFNDVILLPGKLDSARSSIVVDNDNIASVARLVGMKVISSDGILIGVIDSVDIDVIKWRLISLRLKLDKNAYQPLNVKKGLFAKKASGILMIYIESITENVYLSLSVDDLKDQIVLIT